MYKSRKLVLHQFKILSNKKKLKKMKALLTPSTLSALPVLAPLQRWLAELSISPPPAAKPSLVLEVVLLRLLDILP